MGEWQIQRWLVGIQALAFQPNQNRRIKNGVGCPLRKMHHLVLVVSEHRIENSCTAQVGCRFPYNTDRTVSLKTLLESYLNPRARSVFHCSASKNNFRSLLASIDWQGLQIPLLTGGIVYESPCISESLLFPWDESLCLEIDTNANTYTKILMNISSEICTARCHRERM